MLDVLWGCNSTVLKNWRTCNIVKCLKHDRNGKSLENTSDMEKSCNGALFVVHSALSGSLVVF